MKSGIELIAEERREQIEKHGRSTEDDVAINAMGQLAFAAVALCSGEFDVDGTKASPENELYRVAHFKKWCPVGWDKDIWMKMILKPYKERLIISGALIAAELDRLTSEDNSRIFESDKLTEDFDDLPF